MNVPGMTLEFRGLFELVRLRDFSALLAFSRRGDFRLRLPLPARSKCSDFDLGMAEEMQRASRSSSSLSRDSTDSEESEELNDFSACKAKKNFIKF